MRSAAFLVPACPCGSRAILVPATWRHQVRELKDFSDASGEGLTTRCKDCLRRLEIILQVVPAARAAA